jgi:hypothetical protein
VAFLVVCGQGLDERNGSAVPGRYLIRCINRSDLLNHDRRIRSIGGVNPDGAHWKIGEAEAIAAIEVGRWSFYVQAEGRELAVVVAVSKYGSKYLKTVSDALHPEGLLALPECR